MYVRRRAGDGSSSPEDGDSLAVRVGELAESRQWMQQSTATLTLNVYVSTTVCKGAAHKSEAVLQGMQLTVGSLLSR